MNASEQISIRNKILQGIELMYANLIRIKSRNGEGIAISDNGTIRIISADKIKLQADKTIEANPAIPSD